MNYTSKPIKTDAELSAALDRLDVLFDARPGTPEADELQVLSLLVEAYEKKHYPVAPPDPIEAIKFRMEQMGYSQQDLAKVIGWKSRASELLSKKRKLTLSMIRQLHEQLGIPADVLIKAY